jgi:hypothetical protein
MKYCVSQKVNNAETYIRRGVVVHLEVVFSVYHFLRNNKTLADEQISSRQFAQQARANKS